MAHAQQNSPLSPLETRILLSHALGLTRIQLITQSERVLDALEAARLSELFGRRLMGEPIAYLVGQREFYGLPFEVTRDVLIPRPETELLVELALQRLPENGSVLDLGTGSGAVAIAIAHSRPDAQVTAVDVSDAALAVARRNAQTNAVRVDFLQGDWYQALGAQDGRQRNYQFSLIVANPPYIVAGDPHLKQGDLRFEPLGALTDHGDGLAALRSIVAGAAPRLKSGGWLLMEHGYDQAASVRELLIAQGFGAVQSWRDLADIERVSGALRT
ncbi:peptide chain release factor N(5)-glutamine methyltransferase [Undibacterium arcticum]